MIDMKPRANDGNKSDSLLKAINTFIYRKLLFVILKEFHSNFIK